MTVLGVVLAGTLVSDEVLPGVVVIPPGVVERVVCSSIPFGVNSPMIFFCVVDKLYGLVLAVDPPGGVLPAGLVIDGVVVEIIGKPLVVVLAMTLVFPIITV